MIVPVTLTVGNASLTITSAHTGYFLEGQANAVYTLTVSNAVGAPSTSGTITVTEDLPNVLSLVSMAGAGWSCSNKQCTNGSVLGSGSSSPADHCDGERGQECAGIGDECGQRIGVVRQPPMPAI